MHSFLLKIIVLLKSYSQKQIKQANLKIVEKHLTKLEKKSGNKYVKQNFETCPSIKPETDENRTRKLERN